MNSASKIAVVVLLCLIAGCKHKTQAAPPQAAQAPNYPPSPITKDTPLPQVPPPETRQVGLAQEAEQPPPPKPRQKTTHHKPKPADQTTVQAAKDTPPATTQQEPATTQKASAGEPPEMSPIGQLSATGGAGGSLPRRHDIQDQITLTENGLKDINIKRTLTSEEQVTATQIRTFLTKAQQALDQDDLDGANTLVTKAKVLLAELKNASR